MHWRGWLPVTAGLALAASAAWLDYAAGPRVYLAPVYLVPVSLAAWYGGRRSGVVIAAAATAAWLAAQLSLHVPLGTRLVVAWNSAVHLGVYLLVNELLCRLRLATERLESTVVQRTAALEEQQRLATRIAETMPSILYVWDLTTQRITYVNGQLQAVLGFALAEVQNMDRARLASLVDPEDLARITGAIEDATGSPTDDNGRGLPEDAGEHVFDPFFTSKPSGMGMGLAISRSIIEDHGGRLWATPNPDRGATFHVCLPAVTARPTP